MSNPKTAFHFLNTDKIILGLSILLSLFWSIGTQVNIYSNKIVGAIFEFMWLPVILLLFILPIICIIRLFKTSYTNKQLSIYSLLILTITIAFVFFRIKHIHL